MKILPKQTSESGKERSMFLPEDFPVNLSALPEEERERTITAISGHRCYEQFVRYSQLGSLLKTLLESRRWWSPVKRLRWDEQTISSKRITYTERKVDSHSKKSARILKQQDIQSSRLIFQLAVSERHTEENVFGLLPTVQTQGLKQCNRKGKTEFFPLDLLPTPTVLDKGTGKINKSLSPGAKARPTLALSAKKRTLANSLRLRSNQVHQKVQFQVADGTKPYSIGMQRNGSNSINKEENYWKEFPTQSPVCRGNDGIPFDVDSLTISFPKWRQESIKAYGNAWVPQVAYEIFRAIEAETT